MPRVSSKGGVRDPQRATNSLTWLGMYGWYDSVISQIGGIDPSVPIYISDAWNLGQCVNYCKGKNSLQAGKNANPVVIDTHLYWAFTDDDKRKNPSQISQEASTKLSELDGNDGAVTDGKAIGVVIGEYSCVLTEDSWAKAGGHEKEGLVKQFGQSQSHRYQTRGGGSFFWTYRMVCIHTHKGDSRLLLGGQKLTCRLTGLDGRRRVGLQGADQKGCDHAASELDAFWPRCPRPDITRPIPKGWQIRQHVRRSLQLLGRLTPRPLRTLALREGLASGLRRRVELLRDAR